MAEIQDFGKKIGGARKDVWASRGLISSDLTEMNDMERQSYIKKDNIWIKPDWQKVIADGVPQGLAYWQNKMRQSLPPKPPKGDEFTQNNYVEIVCEIRDAVMAVRDPAEISRFYNSFLRPNYLIPSSYNYGRNVIPTAKDIITNKVLKAAQARYYNMEREAKDKLFGIPKEEQSYVRAKESLRIFYYDGDKTVLDPRGDREASRLTVSEPFGHSFYYMQKGTKFSSLEEWQPGTYFVVDENRRKPAANNFNTKEQAEAYVELCARGIQEQENNKTSEKNTSNRKGAFVPPQLRHIKRTGPDYRRGFKANSNLFLKDLKFRGGEFGNWLNNDDRQTCLDMGYDALRDLARVLNIRPEDISLSGKLAIAFGARGRGGANAGAAHYEPDRQVINLTKMSGAGCLAHEWGHALDHAIGISLGEFKLCSESKSTTPAFKDVLESMMYKKVVLSPEEAYKTELPRIENAKKNLKNWLNSVKPHNMTEEYTKQWSEIADRIMNSKTITGGEYFSFRRGDEVLTDPDIELLSQLRKHLTGRGIPRDTKHQFALWVKELSSAETKAQQASLEQRVETDFYKGSKAFDKFYSRASHGYYQSPCEMFARAFDCYIADKLKAEGVKSDFLTAYANSYVIPRENGEIVAAIPLGDERKVIFEKIDLLIDDLKERGLLHDYAEAVVEIEEADKPQKANAKKSDILDFDPHAPQPKYEQLSLEDMMFAASSRLGHTKGKKKDNTHDYTR